MTTNRSTKMALLEIRRKPAPTTRTWLLSGIWAASLLAAGCSDDPQKIPVDNSGVIAGASARVKFCHRLKREGKPITLTVEFGSPALARVSAETGTCSPPINVPCTEVPVGYFPGRLLEGNTLLAPGTFRLAANDEYLLWAEVSNATGRPIVVVDATFNTGQCSGYEGIPRDGGADGGDGGAIGDANAAADVAIQADAGIDAPAAADAAADLASD
jgi:hypothetical protein